MKKAALEGEKRMTVKEVAERLGCHSETVRKHIRELFPAVLQNGKTTYLTEAQVTLVLEHLRKANEDPHNTTYNATIAGAETTQSLTTVSHVADWLIKGHQKLGEEALAQYGGLPYWFDH